MSLINHTETREGLTLTVGLMEYVDEHNDPRQWENTGTMLCGHDRYTLGDEQFDRDHEWAIDCPRCKATGDDPERFELTIGWHGDVVGAGTEEAMYAAAELAAECGTPRNVRPATCLACGNMQQRFVDPVTWIKETHGARVVLPLNLHDHSGISMRVGAGSGWDNGVVGWIYDTPEKLASGWGDEAANLTDEYIAEQLCGEVEDYNAYISGMIYEFTVYRGDPEDRDIVECCGGFFDEDDAKDEGESNFEYHVDKIIAERNAVRYWQERDVITVAS